MSTVTVVTRTCRVCGSTGRVAVPVEGLREYVGGALLQDAFPTMPAPVREQVKTGMHPACWTAMFGEGPA